MFKFHYCWTSFLRAFTLNREIPVLSIPMFQSIKQLNMANISVSLPCFRQTEIIIIVCSPVIWKSRRSSKTVCVDKMGAAYRVLQVSASKCPLLHKSKTTLP